MIFFVANGNVLFLGTEPYILGCDCVLCSSLKGEDVNGIALNREDGSIAPA